MEKNEMNLFGQEGLDLGNDFTAAFDGFTELGNENINDIFDKPSEPQERVDNTTKEDVAETPAPATTEQAIEQTTEATVTEEVKQEKSVATDTTPPPANVDDASTKKTDEVPNYFAEAMAQAETIQAETVKNGLVDKVPMFIYGSAKEEIIDTSKTFDALRIEKAEDFPELDDYSAVSWKMTYGTISKPVSSPKKTTIISMKKKIEDSKEFTEMLKKAKDEITCKVTPSVTAKKKGIAASYKGVALSMTEAEQSGKAISFIPSDDGNVYEMRKNRIGTFIAKADNISILEKVRAGFIPALPKIPYDMLSAIIAFFKSYITRDGELEALAYIYWSVSGNKYYAYVPKQTVSKAMVDSTLPAVDEKDFVLVMEIHSHNTMAAIFSPTDDYDEKATRLYAVVGRLDKVFPDIKVRCSVGGKFIEIGASDVFAGFEGRFPAEWSEAVSVRRKHI